MPRWTLPNLRVEDLMTREVITLEQGDSLLIAQDIMELGRIRHLPVVDGGRLVGLVTHRDLLSASLSSLAAPTRQEDEAVKQTVQVRDVMRREILTARPEMEAVEACRMILRNRYGCLPVVDEQGVLVGIISEADLLRLVERAFEV